MTKPKIALVSATALAIEPAATAIRAALPESDLWNLLDDRLLQDMEQPGTISEPLAARMDGLIETALSGGADGVLLTCSQYGSRADERDLAVDGVAVFSADGPLFDATVALAPSTVLLVASLDAAAADSSARLQQAFDAAGTVTAILPIVVADAARPLSAAELTRVLSDAIARATAEAGGPFDAIVLAQYSLAPAAESLRSQSPSPVLDGPSAAAARLREVVAGGAR